MDLTLATVESVSGDSPEDYQSRWEALLSRVIFTQKLPHRSAGHVGQVLPEASPGLSEGIRSNFFPQGKKPKLPVIAIFTQK